MHLSRGELARIIDHTQVHAYASELDIAKLCEEASEFGFAAVTINPAWTSYCAERLAGSGVGVNPTIGFPLGGNTAHVKLEEARDAVKNGATELDLMINIGALKSGYPDFVEKEIAAVVRASKGIPVKVILDTGYLTTHEKIAVCEMSVAAGAAFVKTSTGFGGTGASVSDVKLLSDAVEGQVGVKAAGGIQTYHFAVALVGAGATRLGTSSSVKIMSEVPENDSDAG